MIKTLHGYFFRELLKTFLLTALALTGLLVMGGGVANILRAEGLGAKEMGKLFAFFTPFALMLVLPVAALFSATICYGRAAADNEITAAKAAGINVHRLLLSAFAIGLFVTGVTYYAWNFLIPVLLGKVQEITRRDLPAIITSQFAHNKALSFGKYRLYADSFRDIREEDLPPDADRSRKYLMLTGVSFVEMEDEQITRFGTSNRTFVIFDQSLDLPSPTVTVELQGVRAVDRSRPVTQSVDLQRQVLGPFEIPLPLRSKMKFQDLPTLRSYIARPDDIPEVSDMLFNFKRGMMEQYLFQDVVEHVSAGYDLFAGDTVYRITAEQMRQSPATNQPELAGVTVLERLASGEQRIMTAERATVELKNALDRERPNVVVELSGGVRIKSSPGSPSDRVVSIDKQSLLPASFTDQPRLVERLAKFTPATALDPEVSFGLSTPKLNERRAALIKRKDKFVSEVRGEIHFRASYAVSAVAVILIGAMLGIVMRGGQVLTAFGISCVPTAIVVIACIVGRNYSDQPEKALFSMGMMWGATGFMYLAMLVVGAKVVQR